MGSVRQGEGKKYPQANSRPGRRAATHTPQPFVRVRGTGPCFRRDDIAGVVRAYRIQPASPRDPLDGGAAGGELVLEALEATVEVIDAVDHGLALGR